MATVGHSAAKRQAPKRLSALCLSGGGIRSAAFSLGVIQALAKRGVLANFNYLSTVSGGGYVGSWLTKRILSRGGEAEKVQEGLKDGQTGLLREILDGLKQGRLLRELADEKRTGPTDTVRRRRRYLTPRPGFWSVGTWQLIGTYLRNLLFNWMVLMPAVIAPIALLRLIPVVLPVVCGPLGLRAEETELEWYLILSGPIALGMILFLRSLLEARRLGRGRDGGFGYKESWARELRFAVMWLLLAGTVLKGAEILQGLWGAGLAVGSGLSMAVVSFLAAGGWQGSGRATAGLRTTLAVVVKVAAVVFMLAVVASLAAFMDWLVERLARLTTELAVLRWAEVPEWLTASVEPAWYLAFVVGGLLLAVWSSTVVDVNNYSLHKVYKERLIHAFLGKADADDPRLCELPSGRFNNESGDDPSHLDPLVVEGRSKLRLFHVLNATLNSGDVSVDRRGLPFTFTPQMHGFWDERLRPHFRSNEKTKDLRLGWAMAISGAAANPNLGHFTSALVRFPMALLNLRLGWWLRHPCSKRPGRGSRLAPLAYRQAAWHIWKAEFFGTMGHGCDCYPDDQRSGDKPEPGLINLSDGGHFDNLGLYEMIRRGCQDVVVVDASADPNRRFKELANALRRVRIDFGVEIRMNALEPQTVVAEGEIGGFQIYKGTIVYSPEAEEHGTLVYVKPEISGEEPADVLAYWAAHTKFPHESTLDQSFSEAQFESYRALGEFTIQRGIDFYNADKGILRPPRLDSSATVVEVLAESAYRKSRGHEWPTLAGGILFKVHSDKLVSFYLVRSSDNRMWVLPKGYIEAGESIGEAARREVEQETFYSAGRWEPFGVERFERGEGPERVAYFLMDLRRATRRPGGRGIEQRPLREISFHKHKEGSPWTVGNKDAVEVGKEFVEILQRAAQEVVERPTLAGGVPYERVSEDCVRFALIRSSDSAQWVLPKGHIERDESPEEAAMREVDEETGYGECEPEPFESDQFERDNRTVRVAYFLMNIAGVVWREKEGAENRDRRDVTLTRRGGEWRLESPERLLPDVVRVLRSAADKVAGKPRRSR